MLVVFAFTVRLVPAVEHNQQRITAGNKAISLRDETELYIHTVLAMATVVIA
jgi:hypothetical protein